MSPSFTDGGSANMLMLHNVHVLGQGLRDISVDGETISQVRVSNSSGEKDAAISFHFDQCLVFPGLINSHDHLHFNSFPRLGHRTYADYVEWGADIHAADREQIDAVLKIPMPLRARWGLYKNLLNGVTTVVHHGERMPVATDLIKVFNRCHSLHSVRQERRWRWRLNKPWAKPWPFVIHAGEGTHAAARAEIDTLLRWNLLKRSLVAIHGVAMTPAQARFFAALIWCPASNDFLLKATADIPRLSEHTAILFGTDSTLTASWNLWEQLRYGRGLGLLRDEALMASLATTPARAWGLRDRGQIKEGFQADIVIARPKKPAADFQSWFDLNPEDLVLVMQAGRILLCEEDRYLQAAKAGLMSSPCSRIIVGGSVKYVAGDLPELMAEIRRYMPEAAFPARTVD